MTTASFARSVRRNFAIAVASVRSLGWSPRVLLPARGLRLALALVGGALLSQTAFAQLNVIYHLSFDSPAAPWAATGSVSFVTTSGTPVIQNTDVAPGIGNTHSAVFNSSQFQAGTNFAGLNPATTGYGVQLWIKNPASDYPSFFWLNIASFGFPGDSGLPAQENGLAIGLYEGEYYGVSNREENGGMPAIRSTVLPGASGSTNGWDHVAFVADGTEGRLYVNGVLQGTRTIAFVAPSSDWHLFAGLDGFPAFTGLADEVKLFTFATGTFSASQLDYAASAIPEPSTYATLAGLAALGLALYRGRQQVA